MLNPQSIALIGAFLVVLISLIGGIAYAIKHKDIDGFVVILVFVALVLFLIFVCSGVFPVNKP